MAAPGQRRTRLTALPPVARARKTSKEDEVRKVFQEIDVASHGRLSLEDLRSYLCDYLGFGQAEAEAIFKANTPDAESSLDFEGFFKGYASLNPFRLLDRRGEVIVRKHGSLCGQMVVLDGLEDCEVYICDVTAQVMMDYCKRCTVLLAPCESSVFVRNCDDCNIWLAAQQLRTRECQRCTFHVYAKTEPIIEMSSDLAFAPWAARYPKCSTQFARARFDPEKNLWNAIFDFSPNKSGSSNWRILPLEDVTELVVELDEAPEAAAPPESPFGPVTFEQLCASPQRSGESAGQSVANIVQVRPSLPASPPQGAAIRLRTFCDGGDTKVRSGMDAHGVQLDDQPETQTIAAAGTRHAAIEMKVGAANSADFYVRAANDFLKGSEAKAGKEAKAAVDELCISGVGDAVGVAAAVATRLETDGVARISRVQTQFPEMPSGRRCARIVILVRATGK